MIEIQTFFLAATIVQAGTGSNYDGKLVGAHHFFPLDSNFPLTSHIPYFLLLRRASRSHDEEITLRFNLLDQDGRTIGLPKEFVGRGVFPKEHKFMTLSGKIEFLFPADGDYSLSIVADEEKLPSTYTYDIEVTSGPK